MPNQRKVSKMKASPVKSLFANGKNKVIFFYHNIDTSQRMQANKIKLHFFEENLFSSSLLVSRYFSYIFFCYKQRDLQGGGGDEDRTSNWSLQ